MKNKTTGMIILRKSCLATGMKHSVFALYMIIYRTSIHASTGYTPFFLMHFREAKLPVHVQVERVVGGSSLPQILTEPEHLKHIDALINLQEQYRAKATQNILCAQTRQKLHNDKKHNTNSIFKVGDKVLKSNARNRHRMGGKLEKPWLGVYIIQKDLGKGRYCLKTLEGKPLKQTIHCARLKRYLDPVVDDNIVDEVEEFDNSDSECAGEQEAANGKGMGDSVHHEENDNDKEQGCQNEEQQSHSPEQREIMEPVSVLEEQLYSPNILRLWRSGACTSYYEAKEDDEEFDVNSS